MSAVTPAEPLHSIAAFAALLQKRERWAGRRVGLALSGGNVDSAVFAKVLASA